MIVVFDYIKFWCALIEYCTYKIMSTLRGSRKLMYSKPNVPQQQHKFIANFAPIAVIGHACHVCTHVMLGLQFGESRPHARTCHIHSRHNNDVAFSHISLLTSLLLLYIPSYVTISLPPTTTLITQWKQ